MLFRSQAPAWAHVRHPLFDLVVEIRLAGRLSAQFQFDNRFRLRRTPIRHHGELLQHCPNPLSLFCCLVLTPVPTCCLRVGITLTKEFPRGDVQKLDSGVREDSDSICQALDKLPGSENHYRSRGFESAVETVS